MSYRKIEVDGVKYRYSVGKSHVKIVQDDPTKKSTLTLTPTVEQVGGGKQNKLKWDEWVQYTIPVTPEMIADYIRKIR